MRENVFYQQTFLSFHTETLINYVFFIFSSTCFLVIYRCLQRDYYEEISRKISSLKRNIGKNGNVANFSSSSWNPQFLSFKIGLTKTTFKALTQSFLVGYRRQSLEKLKNFFFPSYLPGHMEEIIYNVQGVILVTRLMLPLED